MTTNEYIRYITRKDGEPSFAAIRYTEDLDSVHQAYAELQSKGLDGEGLERAVRFRSKRRRIDQARKDGRWQTVDDLNALPDSRNSNQDLERKELEGAVRKSLDVLTPKQRRTVEFVYFQARTQRDAAKEFHCSLQAINTCLKRALSRLQRNPILKSLCPEEN